MAGSTEGSTHEYDGGRVAVAALLGGGVSAGLNLILYYVAGSIGVPFTARLQGASSPATLLPAAQVVGASIAPALVAALVLFLLDRVTRRAALLFVALAGVGLLASLAGPLTLPDASAGTRLCLALMHVIAAVFITTTLLVRARSRRL